MLKEILKEKNIKYYKGGIRIEFKYQPFKVDLTGHEKPKFLNSIICLV